MRLGEVFIQRVCIPSNGELIARHDVFPIHRDHHRPHARQFGCILFLVEQIHDLRDCCIVFAVAGELAEPAELQRDRTRTRADHLTFNLQASALFSGLKADEVYRHSILRIETSIKQIAHLHSLLQQDRMPAQIIRRNEPAEVSDASFECVDRRCCTLSKINCSDSLHRLVELVPHAHHPQRVQTVDQRSSPARELVHILSAYRLERILHPCLSSVACPALLEDALHLQAPLLLDRGNVCTVWHKPVLNTGPVRDG